MFYYFFSVEAIYLFLRIHLLHNTATMYIKQNSNLSEISSILHFCLTVKQKKPHDLFIGIMLCGRNCADVARELKTSRVVVWRQGYDRKAEGNVKDKKITGRLGKSSRRADAKLVLSSQIYIGSSAYRKLENCIKCKLQPSNGISAFKRSRNSISATNLRIPLIMKHQRRRIACARPAALGITINGEKYYGLINEDVLQISMTDMSAYTVLHER